MASTKTRVRPLYEEFEDDTTPRGVSGATIAAIAAGAAAVTAGAVYLLTGERGEQNRERVRAWMQKVRDKMDDVRYRRMVDSVLGKDEDERYDRIR